MRTKHRRGPHRSSAGRGAKHRARAGANEWTIAGLSGASVGPGVTTASLDEVLAAIATVPPDLDWATLRDDVVPVFPRVRPDPIGYPDGVQIVVPPGMSIRFGVDLGPAFLAVTSEMLAAWKLTQAELLATALANLKERAQSVRPGDVLHEKVEGAAVSLLQSGTGSGATFVLLPEELERLFGSAPRLFVAPMRDLLIGLPLDTDRELASDLFELFASQDPNHLAPVAFTFRDRRLTLEAILPGIEMAALPLVGSGGLH